MSESGQMGQTTTVAYNTNYTFCGCLFQVIAINRGGMGYHHHCEGKFYGWKLPYFYDDLKNVGYSVPISDFTSDDKLCRVFLQRLEKMQTHETT